MQLLSQLPPVHCLDATPESPQARPQAPQWPVSVSTSISQPSSGWGAAGEPQLPRPAWQLGLQTPAPQLVLVAPAVEQARPQAPQLAASDSSVTSQPSSPAGQVGVAQSPKPAAQVGAQLPAVHPRLAAPEPLQARPQPPQWSGSVANELSQPSSATGKGGCSQSPRPAWQLGLQRPSAQLTEVAPVVEQARPQPPQFETLVRRSTSQPLSGWGAGGWEQLPKVPVQVEVQTPELQLRAATPVVEQARPQAPQLSTSVPSGVSQPLSAPGGGGVVQSPKPGAQVGAHRPAEQLRAVVPAVEQVRPQAPQ